MYGLINSAIEELIVREFGIDTWNRVKVRAGIDTEKFLTNEPYPDKLTYDLVGAASAVTGVSGDEFLRRFGRHWVMETAHKGYGDLMRACGTTFPEFLTNLPDLHARIEMIFPELQPPHLEISARKANSLQLQYGTHRAGLVPFLEGLLEGLGQYFQTPVRITRLSDRAEGARHDSFLLEWGEPSHT